MIRTSCRAPRQAHFLPSHRLFSTSSPFHNDPTHYETLGLATTATAKDIKKQFYTLSKSHHPDLHPNDPTASSRFVKISEAYTVLGSPEKRAAYDRTVLPASASPTSPQPRGSYSSHTANPAGGRSPSGLSRRRTQFRGPPPSFYRSGGWGAHGAKRAENQAQGRNEGGAQAEGSRPEKGREGNGDGSFAYNEPGTGPGGFGSGFDNDVPHFDREGHYRTQEGVERMRRRARRGWMGREEAEVEPSGSAAGGFFAVTAVIGVVFAFSALFAPSTKRIDDRRRETGTSAAGS
ncbi:DnaJ subfamily B member 9 [Sphaceloma murrayae]|uniref:DnaJ subfamily B member 9 n=1 Tax=Sphaceloma murrayae TaxID=2082308 RepID=A0A2K1QG02_9PEZI|nr:DnaJ subfamily B member 9 [Sphaceloma murrayae]